MNILNIDTECINFFIVLLKIFNIKLKNVEKLSKKIKSDIKN